jgi:hypothetical protein
MKAARLKYVVLGHEGVRNARISPIDTPAAVFVTTSDRIVSAGRC